MAKYLEIEQARELERLFLDLTSGKSKTAENKVLYYLANCPEVIEELPKDTKQYVINTILNSKNNSIMEEMACYSLRVLSNNEAVQLYKNGDDCCREQLLNNIEEVGSRETIKNIINTAIKEKERHEALVDNCYKFLNEKQLIYLLKNSDDYLKGEIIQKINNKTPKNIKDLAISLAIKGKDQDNKIYLIESCLKDLNEEQLMKLYKDGNKNCCEKLAEYRNDIGSEKLKNILDEEYGYIETSEYEENDYNEYDNDEDEDNGIYKHSIEECKKDLSDSLETFLNSLIINTNQSEKLLIANVDLLLGAMSSYELNCLRETVEREFKPSNTKGKTKDSAKPNKISLFKERVNDAYKWKVKQEELRNKDYLHRDNAEIYNNYDYEEDDYYPVRDDDYNDDYEEDA